MIKFRREETDSVEIIRRGNVIVKLSYCQCLNEHCLYCRTKTGELRKHKKPFDAGIFEFVKVVKVEGGYIGFDYWTEYHTWINQK